MVVHHAGAFVVHALGIRSNDLAADLARDLQHAAVESIASSKSCGAKS